MSTFAKVEEELLGEYFGAKKYSSDFMPHNKISVPLAISLPGQLIFNENLFRNRPEAAYFQEQSPRTSRVIPGSNNPLSIFIAHTHSDGRLLQKIDQILQTISYQEQNVNYQFGEIALDTRWKVSRHDYLTSVDLILLLVTQSFIATEYCYSEQLRWAILRHCEEKSYVIPILLQACLWDGTPFAELHTITPNNHKAVDEWPRSGPAFKAIANDIRNAVRIIRNGR